MTVTGAGAEFDVVASRVLLSAVALDGVEVVADDGVTAVDDAEGGTEPWDVPAVGPGDELGAGALDDPPVPLGACVTAPPVATASDGDSAGAASTVGVDGAVATAVVADARMIPRATQADAIASTAAVTRLDDTAPRARRARRITITSSAPDVTAGRPGFSIRPPGRRIAGWVAAAIRPSLRRPERLRHGQFRPDTG